MPSSRREDPAGADAVGPVGRADALGWASALLGAPMVLAPRRLLREIGVRPDAPAIAVTIAVGLREFSATQTINLMHHRRVGAWARVAGDIMDLTLLGSAFKSKRQSTMRLAGAIGLVGGILAADAVTAVQLSRAEGAHLPEGAGSHGDGADHEPSEGPAHARKSVTIRKAEEEVRRAFRTFDWSAFDPAALEVSGEVRFVRAPGDRGVEVHIDHVADVNSAVAAATKLVGQAPDQRMTDDLRRFKSFVETGVQVRSEKSPEGQSALRQMVQRPGQPLGVGG